MHTTQPYVRPFYQSGRGLGNLIGGLFRRIIPSLTKVAKPILKSGFKRVRPHVAEFGRQVVSDTLHGENLATSIKKRAKQGAANVIEEVLVDRKPYTVVKPRSKRQRRKFTRRGKRDYLS